VGPFPFIGAGPPRTTLEEYSLLIRFERDPPAGQLHDLIDRRPAWLTEVTLDGPHLLVVAPQFGHLADVAVLGPDLARTPNLERDLARMEYERHAMFAALLAWLLDVHAAAKIAFTALAGDAVAVTAWHEDSVRCHGRAAIDALRPHPIAQRQLRTVVAHAKKAGLELSLDELDIVEPLGPAMRAARARDTTKFLALIADLDADALHFLVLVKLRDVPWALWTIIPRVLEIAEEDNDLRAFLEGAFERDPHHDGARTLLAACLARARASASPALWANRLGLLAYDFVGDECWDAATELYEAAISLPEPIDLSVYTNALWVLQHDNTGRPVDPARNHRFLAACLPHAPRNPAIYFNAACLTFEMGDDETTLVHLARCIASRYPGAAAIQDEQLFQPLRARDPRFDELFAAPRSR